ncbi:DUF3179 domain-containing (seleno)protein [Vibrio breoganii]|uniref:DUF3179 domain-containing (seleno)protein n=1 Tax=Vibrio breoganii TaxID=553239 RepID=UPI000C862185|nr:DUF3179 domain-containing (seleno)protein [Vibrio breoganii]PMK49186.1 hypothetical protein BCU00_04535 [Vibrio breoganii]PMM10383.1 hypothetical protein BCT61_08680 [Vibrio breoganii]TKG29532.1 DUF3179 domain-containing protein [Vibrio breoganii]
MKKVIFNVYAAALASIAIFCAILMTEPGQSLAVPRDWVLGYYKNLSVFITLQLIALAGLWILSEKWKMWNRKLMSLATIGVFLTFWAESHAMPTAFPTEQFNAEYFTVEEADEKIPAEDQRVYVVEQGDEVRIFPRYHIQLPHVAGWKNEDTDYAITFCGLSNLAMVVETDYGLGEADLQVLGQAHNNLIFKDVNNGTAIQQATMQSEFTDHNTKVIPNTMMDWEEAKALYPEAQVYLYGADRMIDGLLYDLFEQPLIDQRDLDNEKFIFPTLSLTDQRMNPKTEIFGYDNGEGQQIAIDPNFARDNDGYQFEFGNEKLRIETDGSIVRLVNAETMQQVPTHNGFHFGIWAEYFPESEVLQ